MAKVDELSAQLKDERLRSLELNKRLQTTNLTKAHLEQVKRLRRQSGYHGYRRIKSLLTFPVSC